MSDMKAFMCSVAFVLIGVLVVWFAHHQIHSQPQPRNMPDLAEVRQIMLDCEQFNPGKRCIFVAMVVPDFSESITKGE